MKKLLLLLLLVTFETFAGIPLSSNFTMNAALPIEDRMSVADVTARDALSSLRRWEGMLVYVVADGKHYTLIGGITNGDWTELSGGGGGAGNLALWETAKAYVIGDTVIESNKIYYALTDHTSGTFATDLANNDWIELSAPPDISNLVTGPASATDNALARYDSTTGKLVKNSVGILSDTGDLSGIDDLDVDGTATVGSLSGVVKAVTGLLSASALDLTTDVTGVLPIANGGTGASTKAAAFDALSPMTTGGDLIYGDTSGTGTRLANGTAGQFLKSNGTTLAPSWDSPSPGNLTGAITSTGLATVLGSFSSSDLSTALTDETGTGLAVFNTSPALVTPDIDAAIGDSLVLGGTKDASAILDVQSTTQGVLPPRMTTTQMNAITSPATGLTVYNTDFNVLAVYNGTVWTYNFSTLNAENILSATVDTAGILTFNNMGLFTSCTNANPSVCTFDSTKITQIPICIATAGAAGARIVTIQAISSTTVSVHQYLDNGTDARSDFTLFCQKQGTDYQSTNAWVQANSNPIATTTDFSFTSSASGVVSNENVDVVNGNCTNSAPSVCTFNSTIFGVSPNIVVNSNTGGWFCSPTAISTSSFSIRCYDHSGSEVTTSTIKYVHIQKATTDYTAAHSPFIIGTFTGTPKVPGLIGAVDTFFVSYGTTNLSTICTASPCLIDQIGTAVSNITRSTTGTYVLNTAKTYTKLKCSFDLLYGTGASANTNASDKTCTSCNSLSFTTRDYTAGTTLDSYGMISCQGTY